MGKKEKYLAKLIRAQLKQEEVPSLPEGVTVDEIVQIAKKHHLNYLLLGALIRVDNLTEEERVEYTANIRLGNETDGYETVRCAGAGTERAGKIV